MTARDRLRAHLTDHPEAFSPPLRLIAEALLEATDPAHLAKSLGDRRKRESERWARALHRLLTEPAEDIQWAPSPRCGRERR